MPHAHHSLSPSLSYTKSPIPTIVGHTNNVNASNAYTCNAPFGLKPVENVGVGIGVVSSSPATNAIGNSNSVVSSSNSSSSCSVPGLGTVSGISVITSMGSNSLCSSSATGGEGPPTPTQELDLSGTALEQHQQQQAAVAAAAATAALAVAQAAAQLQQAAQQSQQQRKSKLISNINGITETNLNLSCHDYSGWQQFGYAQHTSELRELGASVKFARSRNITQTG